MVNMRESGVALLAVIVLSTSMCSVVLGSDQLPWNVERVRPYCVWDNDNAKAQNATAWDIDQTPTNYTGQNIRIAIIDSGMDYYVNDDAVVIHPDLSQNVADYWGMTGFKYDSSNPNVPPVDVYTDPVRNASYIRDTLFGHGTEVAGVVAAAINGLGLIGVAPNVTIYSLKMNSLYSESMSEEEAAAAINFAAMNLSVDIINISAGWTPNNTDLYNAIYNAANMSKLIFVAAGNEGRAIWQYPALYSNRNDYPVTVVGATCENDSRASFSNYDANLTFMAPGDNVTTTYLNESYTIDIGTSLSTPAAAAVAALIWSSKVDRNYVPYGNEWNWASVWHKMNDTTYDLLSSGWDNDTGWGLVNAWLSNQRPMGDVNGDQMVEGRDMVVCMRAYMTVPGDPLWDPRADINIDKIVDGRDIIIVARHYGESDP